MTVAQSDLAVFGGPKMIPGAFRPYNPIGLEELQAASEVIRSGVLSQFIGAPGDRFYGGPKVREFEQVCRDYFQTKHAVTMNSLTSGLIAAVGAIGVEPGDEVITSPWTMCATATAILHWNAIPVFADIEPETFCIDPGAVKAQITPQTRAIIAVDVFGQSADIEALRALATAHDLHLISDSAQAPGAKYRSRLAGTLSSIGGYSLNYHKHIHTGEGGILVTDDDTLAERLMLIRNHGEAVVQDSEDAAGLRNVLGYNFRLGEIECAMGIPQLRKLDGLVARRQRAAGRLAEGLASLPGLSPPVVREGCTHAYYVFPLVLDAELAGVREPIRRALQAEGVPDLAAGYQNVHLLPMYQRKIAYGSAGFPWRSPFARREVDYRKGICPVAERLHDSTFLGLATWRYDLSDDDVDRIVAAFKKVWDRLDTLLPVGLGTGDPDGNRR